MKMAESSPKGKKTLWEKEKDLCCRHVNSGLVWERVKLPDNFSESVDDIQVDQPPSAGLQGMEYKTFDFMHRIYAQSSRSKKHLLIPRKDGQVKKECIDCKKNLVADGGSVLFEQFPYLSWSIEMCFQYTIKIVL